MNFNKAISITSIIFNSIISGYAYAAPASYDQTWGNSVEAKNQSAIDLINDHQNQITQNKLTSDNNEAALQTHINNVDSDLNSTKLGVIIINNDLQQTKTQVDANTADIQALKNMPVPTNGLDGKDGVDGKDGAQGIQGVKGDTGAQGIQGAKGATGAQGKDGVAGKDGVNGKNGADGRDGVTSTVTNVRVDTATQAKVAANSQQIATNTHQEASIVQDLQDARSMFNQTQANTNNQFKSLRDEVDGNKKEARSGVASAVAIASMPQVEAGQKFMVAAGVGSFKDEQAISVGASFHAGNATVKTGLSTSTNNDMAIGAGLGIGF